MYFNTRSNGTARRFGFHAIAPGNIVEISSQPGVLGHGGGGVGPNGSSGLRLTNMKSTYAPQTNPGPGVLSVDANGDVIYVPTSTVTAGSGVLGNLCSGTQNPLPGSYEVPLNNSDFFFSGDNTNVDKVNVGLNCGIVPPGKFNVNTNFASDPSNLNRSFSIYSTNKYTGNNINTAVYGEATGGGFFERGVWGMATGFRDARGIYGQGGPVTAGNSFGGYFEAITGTNQTNMGLFSLGKGGSNCYGGRFESYAGTNVNIAVSGHSFPSVINYAPTYASGINIAIYGQTDQTNPLTAAVDFAGFFDGDVWINGTIMEQALQRWCLTSNLKQMWIQFLILLVLLNP